MGNLQRQQSLTSRSTECTATMAFTKTIKNNAYYSRYQVKYKRRRSGKTDYAARKKLISQAKNKYNAPKHRLVVRFTNKDIICQIVSSELNGDRVVAAAYAHELKRYGITHGLTNWAAAYATGLLVARRTLKKFDLDEDFPGVEEPDGEFTLTEATEGDESRRPFKAFLDVGLVRTSTGARVFGGHVAEYMETLADDDEERYKTLFNGYIEDGIEADGLEELYADAHKQIREDPFKKDDDEGEKKSKDYWKEESKKYKKGKLTSEQRRERVKARIEELKEEMA